MDPCLTEIKGCSTQKRGKMSFQRKLIHHPPAQQLLVVHHGSQGLEHLASSVLWDRANLFPVQWELSRWHLQYGTKAPSLQATGGSKWSQWRVIRSPSKAVHLFSFPIVTSISGFLQTALIHQHPPPTQSYAEGSRVCASKVHKNIQFTHSCICLA